MRVLIDVVAFLAVRNDLDTIYPVDESPISIEQDYSICRDPFWPWWNQLSLMVALYLVSGGALRRVVSVYHVRWSPASEKWDILLSVSDSFLVAQSVPSSGSHNTPEPVFSRDDVWGSLKCTAHPPVRD